MMNREKYSKLKQDSQSLSPAALVALLGFNNTMHKACNMLNNEEWNTSLQKYATHLLEELRKKYPQKWNENWRYDALLGYAYHIILKYDERYTAYMRAFDKIQPTPPELLVAIARCSIAPETPPISEESYFTC